MRTFYVPPGSVGPGQAGNEGTGKRTDPEEETTETTETTEETTEETDKEVDDGEDEDDPDTDDPDRPVGPRNPDSPTQIPNPEDGTETEVVETPRNEDDLVVEEKEEEEEDEGKKEEIAKRKIRGRGTGRSLIPRRPNKNFHRY